MGKKIALAIGYVVVTPLVVLLVIGGEHYGGWPVAHGILPLLLALTWALRRYSRIPAPLRHMEKAKKRIDGAAPLTLADYQGLVATLPAPSEMQQQDFARFVSEAHSWYKHLPLYQPGATFQFFIDPFAGCDRILSRDGRFHFAPREKRGFHYASIPTRDYRERFGYLAFSCAEGTKVCFHNTMGTVVPSDDLAAVADKGGRLRPLPPEIRQAGAVRLTAAIHRVSACFPWWDWRAPRQAGELNWPEESGGTPALQRLFARSRELRAASDRDPGKRPEEMEIASEFGFAFVDPVLYELLKPERERQQREMVSAIQRMNALVFDHSKHPRV